MNIRKHHTRRLVAHFAFLTSLAVMHTAFAQTEDEPLDVDEADEAADDDSSVEELPTAAPTSKSAVTASVGGDASASAEAPAAEPTSAEMDSTAGASSDADAAAEAEAAAIEAQLLQEAVGDVSESEYKLDIYGFLDFTYSHQVKEFAVTAPYNSFYVGRFNLYLASDLGDNWHSLAEARITYLPSGSTTFNPDLTITRTDTTATDYSDLNRPIRWGGTVIERAWLEYSAHPLLNVRAGHWLTPYGIWNVDHGSPVIIGVRRPFIVGESLLPASQTGLQIHGQHLVGPAQLGYHFTVSNGRGPIDTHQDLNHNKAIGGRLFARVDTPSAGTLHFGVSGYKGRYTDRGQEFVPLPDGTFETQYPRVTEYEEASLGGDLKWTWGGFLLQSEAILNDVVYDDLRPAAFTAPPQPQGFASDYRRIGIYGLTGYRFDFLGIMPFGGAEYYDAGSAGFLRRSAAIWGGFNLRPTPRVVLKTQYTYSWFPKEDLPDNYHFNNLDFQAAWSF